MDHRDDGTLAGWHQDPSGRHELRFWNGDRWTEHVIDGGIPGLDFPTRSGRAPSDTTASSPPPPPEAEPLTEAEPDIEAEAEAEPVIETDAAPAEIDLVAEEHTDAATDPTLVETETETETEPETEAETETDIEPATIVIPDDERAAVAAASSVLHASVGDAAVLSRSGGRSLRSGRGPASPQPAPSASPPNEAGNSGPVEAVDARESVSAPPSQPGAPAESAPSEPGPSEPGPSERAPSEPGPERVVPDPAPPERDDVPARVARSVLGALTGPTVASPAGNSAGSNTSAIADPHAATVSHSASEVPGTPPRVAGVAPIPVKRYRPGSPPPSPFARPQALSAAPGTIGTVVVPWYRKPIAWLMIVAILAAAVVVGVIALTRDEPAGNRLGGRPPAAAPQGSKIIDGDGFAIAAPVDWIAGTEPGDAFPQLRRTNWQTPLVAVDGPHHEAMIVVPLSGLRHKPQVDPELFWSDQVRDAGSGRPITESPPFGVHGFRANRVSVTDLSGAVVVAASIDTGDRTFLVAFSAPSTETANTRFERFIQTFDVR